jgi:hypothetical protein
MKIKYILYYVARQVCKACNLRGTKLLKIMAIKRLRTICSLTEKMAKSEIVNL